MSRCIRHTAKLFERVAEWALDNLRLMGANCRQQHGSDCPLVNTCLAEMVGRLTMLLERVLIGPTVAVIKNSAAFVASGGFSAPSVDAGGAPALPRSLPPLRRAEVPLLSCEVTRGALSHHSTVAPQSSLLCVFRATSANNAGGRCNQQLHAQGLPYAGPAWPGRHTAV